MQKNDRYDPIPKLALNVPFPVILPVVPSTETPPSLRLFGKSVKSTVISGLKLTISGVYDVLGNVNLYKAVRFDTVISATIRLYNWTEK
jgi:hypothetical protein